MRKNTVLRGIRQRGDIRETGNETIEIRNNGLHLRLLQHDLRYPNPIRSDALLPGQVFSAVLVEPLKQPAGKTTQP